MLSIIIPCYNEGENIKTAYVTIRDIIEKKIAEKEPDFDFEIIFADDGSSDFSREAIINIAAIDKRVKGLIFSRNFGKEGAIFAGLSKAKGDCAVVIDCDLQHPPELIPKMYELYKQGFEVVQARKVSRGNESAVYKFFAQTFYKLMKSSSGLNLDGASDYKLLSRKAVEALNAMPERLTFFRALSAWIGFKTAQVDFEVRPRVSGKTKWNFGKLFKFALSSVTGFTDLPLKLTTGLGIIFFIFALILGLQTLIRFFSGAAAEGFSTVILLLLIIGSVLMLALGVIGYYLSKIYEEIKFRPRYIIEEEINGEEE